MTIGSDDTRFTTYGCGYWEAGGTPVTFSGTGSQVTPPFQLQDGAAIIAGSHVGSRNFIVQLVNGLGEDLDLVANEIGDARVSDIARLDGSYWLSVSANGPWTIRAHY